MFLNFNKIKKNNNNNAFVRKVTILPTCKNALF